MAARGVLCGIISRVVSTQIFNPVAAQRFILGVPSRSFHTSYLRKCSADDQEKLGAVERDPSKARDQVIPVETSIAYLESEAYQVTYGDNLVWTEYRRNFKGHYPPNKTRKTCIRQDRIATGNPCPICRDEYLVVDYRNLKLLKQFISPYTGAVIDFKKTGLCQKRHKELLIAVEKARDCGLLTYDVPHRVYNYSDYLNIKQ